MPVVQSKVLDLTADDILNIKADHPEALFQPSLDAIADDFQALTKKWHPDRNSDPQASEVMARVVELRKSAKSKLESHSWQEAGYFTCALSNGKKFRVRSDASHTFELGTMHISPTTITYVVKRDYADLFKNAVAIADSLTFPDDKMKKAFESCLPTAFKTYEAPDALILTVRSEELILLSDLKPFLAKENLDKHTAWITSRLHDMVRYLDYAGITHNAITTDNVFVSPAQHTIGLLGGWWYAAPFHQTLKAVPAAAEEFLNDDMLKTHRPDPSVDREMVRAVSRELLGDRGGTRLNALKSAPQPMIDYLRLPSSGNAQKDLEHWYEDIVIKSFGARRFTKLPVTYSDVYLPKGS